jgi:hypothetical protein
MLNSATTSIRRRRSPGRLLRAAAPAIVAAALFPSSALAGPVSQTFSQPGETAFTVPPNVNQIHIDAFGAPGGNADYPGGAGAEVQGDLAVASGQTLYVEVGVGGGTAHDFDEFYGPRPGGAGGGESDVRTCSATAASCSILGYGPVSSAQTQLLVAAGGGSSGIFPTDGNHMGLGGNAGLLNGNGADGQAGGNADGGKGATADSAGLGGSSHDGGPAGADGSAGLGGDGFDGGGAGGAGRYGGGGGGGIYASYLGGAGGGGGGSSWVNQDMTGVGAYLTHITGASSAASNASPHVVISYTPIQKPGPIPTIQSPASQELVGASPEFVGTGGGNTDDQQSVTVSIYSGQSATGSPVETFSTALGLAHGYDISATSPLASGTYTAVISQQDNAGDTGSSWVTFVVDASGPAVTITQPADGSATANPSVQFEGAAGTKSKDLGIVGFELDDKSGVVIQRGVPVSDGHWSADVPWLHLQDGVYTATVQQIDNGGNTTTVTTTFTVDTINPTASVSTPADGGTYHVGDHVAAAYGCADNGSGVASCAGPVAPGAALDTATPGQHAFTVVATDNGGNTSSTTVHYTVLPVSQPPSGPGAGQPSPGSTTSQPPGPGTTTGQPSGPGTSIGQGNASSPAKTRAPAGLRLVSGRLRAAPRGCSMHPRPQKLSARACSTALVSAGLIDPRAAGQSVVLTWTDHRGHTVRHTVKVASTGRWTLTFALPGSARVHPGSVSVTYAGSAVLLPAAASRKVALAR